jgi:ATP-dependent RNA helicase DeaD
MLSMGFVEDLDFIRDCLVHTHQTLLFSATMSKSIRSLAERFLSNPVEIKLNREKLSPDQIQHFFVACQPGKKLRRLVDLYKELEPAYSIIFCQSRHSCEGLVKDTKNQIRGVDYLHGGLSQDVRRIITRKFRTKKTRHLIATDVASRGLDFSGISHVFHYELPHDPEVFVHRSGRTGRNDASGVVVTLVTPRDRRMLDRICKMMGKEAQWIGEPLQKEGKKSTKGKRPQRKTARKGDAEARN